MFKKRIWLGIILSVILLVFSVNGFTAYYKYTQESGTNFYVGTADKSDALEDTNEMRQIIDDLGALLVHSKRNDLYPKDLTTGGTIQIPETGLKFSNDPANDDIAAYIAGEMMWQTKAELGLDLSLYYLKTSIDTQGEVETIWGVSLVNDGDLDLYYLKTAIDTLGEVETIYSTDIVDTTELATALADYYLKTAIDSLSEVETIWSVDVTDSTDLATALTDYYLKTAIDTQGEVENIWGVTLATDTELAALKFTDLTDTPANYTDQAGKYVKVNAGETALEFGTPGGGVDTSGTPEVNDIARFTDVDTIEGVNYTELKTALALSSDDLSDRDTIGMLDEEETVTGAWDFSLGVDIIREDDTPGWGPYLFIKRRRDGDPTYDVSSGDMVGDITFYAWANDNYEYIPCAEIFAWVDGTPGDNDMPGRLEFRTTPDGSGTGVLRMAIDNAGNIKMGDGAWTNYANIDNAGVLTFEGTANIPNVVFPATQVPSADVNTLDDYEEGTWTAAFVCGTSGTITIDGSYNTGLYTKIGRQVTVTGQFKVAEVSSPIGKLTLTGLPFTSKDSFSAISAISVRANNLAVGAITYIQGWILSNTTEIVIEKFEAGSKVDLAGDVQANVFFAISATYFTD